MGPWVPANMSAAHGLTHGLTHRTKLLEEGPRPDFRGCLPSITPASAYLLGTIRHTSNHALAPDPRLHGRRRCGHQIRSSGVISWDEMWPGSLYGPAVVAACFPPW